MSIRQPSAEWFLRACGALFVILACSKLMLLTAGAVVSNAADPVMPGMSVRDMTVLALAFEGCAGVALLVGRSVTMRACVAAGLSGSFAAYRLVRLVSGVEGSCACLGILGRSAGLGTLGENVVSWSILTFVLIGSYAILLTRRVRACVAETEMR